MTPRDGTGDLKCERSARCMSGCVSARLGARISVGWSRSSNAAKSRSRLSPVVGMSGEQRVGVGHMGFSRELRVIFLRAVVRQQFLDATVRVAQEELLHTVDAAQGRRGARFRHPLPREVTHFRFWLQQTLLDDEHRQLRAGAAGDPHDTDVTAGGEDSPDGPSTAQCFVVGVRCDDEQRRRLHQPVADRRSQAASPIPACATLTSRAAADHSRGQEREDTCTEWANRHGEEFLTSSERPQGLEPATGFYLLESPSRWAARSDGGVDEFGATGTGVPRCGFSGLGRGLDRCGSWPSNLQPLRAFREARVSETVVFFRLGAVAGGTARTARYIEEATELARQVTAGSLSLPENGHRLVVCSGGGPGINEAVNRGATLAGGRSVGLNIGLPHEQRPNPYITPELSFEFHYFFMRKLWFAHLARAIVVFPGGFGTFDELFEMLTLAQTRKLDGNRLILLYGAAYWNEVINFEALVRHGVIAPEDLKLFSFVDTPAEALARLQKGIVLGPAAAAPAQPAFAKSRHPNESEGG